MAEDIAVVMAVRSCGRLILVADANPAEWRRKLADEDGILWIEMVMGERCTGMERELRFEVEPRARRDGERAVLARSFRMSAEVTRELVGVVAGISGLVDVFAVAEDGSVGNFLAVFSVDGLNGEIEERGVVEEIADGDQVKRQLERCARPEVPDEVMKLMREEAEGAA